jgi:hypothetical protein
MLLSDLLAQKDKLENLSIRFPDIQIGQPSGIYKPVFYSSSIICNSFDYKKLHSDLVEIEFFYLDELTGIKVFTRPYLNFVIGKGDLQNIHLDMDIDKIAKKLRDPSRSGKIGSLPEELVLKVLEDLEKRSPVYSKLGKFLSQNYYDFTITNTGSIKIPSNYNITFIHLSEIKKILDIQDIKLTFEDDCIFLIPQLQNV